MHRAPAHISVSSEEGACDSPEHRQFDFWIGEWEVTIPGTDYVVGTNRIESILGGCALQESWLARDGAAGNSYNAYDAQAGTWIQTWVDNGGFVLRIDGSLVGEKMVLSGPGKDSEGNEIINRVTWTPHPDDTVEQTWEASADGGQTWSETFAGLYRKRSQ